MDRTYWVYILANVRADLPVLYVGVTSDLPRRVAEHRERTAGFTARYNVTTLVYVEVFRYVRDAIHREKQLKSWRRDKKVALIERRNPAWRDISLG